MRFGIREICDVVFKAKADTKIGAYTFKKDEPVLYIDSAKTSSLEGTASPVYATGGRGNPRLAAWEGEKTLTFTVEDALLSPVSFAMLSGAGLFKGAEDDNKEVHVHVSNRGTVSSTGVIDLTDVLKTSEKIDSTAPVFVQVTDKGSITGDKLSVVVDSTGKKLTGAAEKYYGKEVFVDFYVTKKASKVSEIQIDAKSFAGSYYVEASTLFRDIETGKDMPAEITFPNVKIQSNFTFSMASEGDPSTFTFTMDVFPGYTIFNQTKKEMCLIQIIEDAESEAEVELSSVMAHPAGFSIESTKHDSTSTEGELSI